jgi:glycosyltransferase involved in cell wall biosynthesis
MPLLSVIVPVYNEANTIRDILNKIFALSMDKEIIVVDDASTDATPKILREISYPTLKVIHHTSNRGKGAAFLTGLTHATGELVLIQDADLEYNPDDYAKLLERINSGEADLVLGSRFVKGYHGLLIHQLGNRFLTRLLNTLFCSQLNDYATCYKLARRSTYETLNLSATGFDIDVEIVCNVLKRNLRVAEVPVSYHPRTYRAGKKIRLKDGLLAIFFMWKYRFVD